MHAKEHEKKVHAKKHEKKRKREIKIAHIFKTNAKRERERESHTQRSLELGKNLKSHTLALLDQSV